MNRIILPTGIPFSLRLPLKTAEMIQQYQGVIRQRKRKWIPIMIDIRYILSCYLLINC